MTPGMELYYRNRFDPDYFAELIFAVMFAQICCSELQMGSNAVVICFQLKEVEGCCAWGADLDLEFVWTVVVELKFKLGTFAGVFALNFRKDDLTLSHCWTVCWCACGLKPNHSPTTNPMTNNNKPDLAMVSPYFKC